MKGKYTLTLTAINKYGEEIKVECAISLHNKELDFTYNGKCHTITYKETRKGNYFLLNKVRYYFKVWDNYENK